MHGENGRHCDGFPLSFCCSLTWQMASDTVLPSVQPFHAMAYPLSLAEMQQVWCALWCGVVLVVSVVVIVISRGPSRPMFRLDTYLRLLHTRTCFSPTQFAALAGASCVLSWLGWRTVLRARSSRACCCSCDCGCSCYYGGYKLIGPTIHTKTYIFTNFYEQYLVLFTMVPRDGCRWDLVLQLQLWFHVIGCVFSRAARAL